MPTLAKNLSTKINSKISSIPNPAIRSFNQKISTIPGIIKLTIGEPDLNTPEHIKRAAIDDINSDDSHYAPEAGKGKYLEAVSKYLAKGAKAVIITDPSNPTGRVYSKKNLQELAAVITKYDIFAVSDEIYAELIYGQKKHYSLTQFIPERTVLLSGLSKSVAMTGWRIGYIAGPAELMKSMIKVNSFLISAVTDNVQAAATEALNHGDQDYVAARKKYQKRMHLLQDGLEKNGYTMATPEGAFYIFAKIPSKFGCDDVAFASDLAEKAKVGVTPGSYFGAGGQGYVRLS